MSMCLSLWLHLFHLGACANVPAGRSSIKNDGLTTVNLAASDRALRVVAPRSDDANHFNSEVSILGSVRQFRSFVLTQRKIY